MFDHMTWVERDLAPVFEHFAALVAAHEREECAQLLERTDLSGLGTEVQLQVWVGKMLMGFAEAIRARGRND